MALKENRQTNKQKIVHKRQHRNLKTKQHEPHGNSSYYQIQMSKPKTLDIECQLYMI